VIHDDDLHSNTERAVCETARPGGKLAFIERGPLLKTLREIHTYPEIQDLDRCKTVPGRGS